jgi:phosphodiesterase/alkaline phosphatase D-like protein
MNRSTRRELIGTAAAGAAFAAVPPAWAKRLLSQRASVGQGRFLDGVASGEPSATAVTFWSKLTTARPSSGARLIVARDENLRKVVATTVVPTGRSIDGTVKVRIGGLKPHSHYYYVWESRDDVSPVGRTRTLVPGDSTVDQHLAFSSCQSYGHGYYRAHADAAAQDLDLYVFLGDYIYETRRAASATQPRTDPLDSNDLRSYRTKYRVYRSDEALRELHRVHPAVHIWDDHEVANNYTDNRPAPSAAQRAAAYRAAFEWLPRMVFPTERYRIFKRIPIGRTVDLFLLDERQYRTVDDAGNPVRILGERQIQWLIDGLKSSSAKWKIIANQVQIAPLDFGSGESQDSWGGYPESRARLLGEIEGAGIPNVVFITGDSHVFMTNVLASDFETFRSDPNRHPAAVEYLGGSVTTPGTDRVESEVQAKNPWNRQFNGVNHGYALLGASSAQLVTEYRRSDILDPNGATAPFERFTQPDGTNNPSRQSLSPRARV